MTQLSLSSFASANLFMSHLCIDVIPWEREPPYKRDVNASRIPGFSPVTDHNDRAREGSVKMFRLR